MLSQGEGTMKQTLIDTDILSMFFRDNQNVCKHFQKYLTAFNQINISIITYYEILSGLKHQDAKKRLDLFVNFTECNTILPLNTQSAQISSGIYADLRKQGKPIDDIDLLIAGIALANDLVLITHNTSHFKRITTLEMEDWSEN